MGEVYEAEHTTLEKRYALKLLPADFATRTGALDRFRREAKVMANLEHPGIVRVDDFGEAASRYWLRMELVEGESLQDYADAHGGKVPQDVLLGILKQVCEGLQYAHERGAIHRDLKPNNIMVGRHGEVQVLDWGLSKVFRKGSVSAGLGGSHTQSGHIVGTPYYMAPEQARGEAVDHRTDIYALGVILYELLTLSCPFEGEGMAVLASILTGEPEAPRRRAPERAIPLELEAVCLRALEKPTRRNAAPFELCGPPRLPHRRIGLGRERGK